MASSYAERLNEVASSSPPSPGSAGTSKAPGDAASVRAGGGGVPSQSASSPPSSKAPSALDQFFTGAADTATFGLADEIGGFLSTITPLHDYAGQQSVWKSGKGFGGTLASNIAIERAQMQAGAQAHPVTTTAGQLGGAFLIPAGAGAKGVKGLAVAGAAQGAAYGAGSGVGASDRLKKAGEFGVAGGIFGAALGAAGTAVSKIRASFAKTPSTEVSQEAAQAATDRVSKLVPEGTILGQTKEGTPILGAKQVNGAGEDIPSLSQALIPVERVAGQEAGKAGTDVAAPAAEAAGSKATPDAREALKGLQDFVDDMAQKLKTNDRAADITWENAPDVAQRTGEWRIGSLEKPEDVEALLGAVTRGVTSKITRSDQELGQTALGVADRIGEDPDAILAYAKEIAGKTGDADTAMMALRTVWARASQDVTDFHLMNVDWDTASDELVQAASERIYNLSAISAEVQKAKTGLGRALRSIQLPSADLYRKAITDGMEYVGKDVPRTGNPLPTTRQDISDWFELWGTSGGDPKRQSAILQGLLTSPSGWKYLRQSAANWFTASILSMPKTLTLNIVGPGIISVLKQAERITGASYVSIRPWSTPAERAAARAVARSSAKAYIQTISHAGDAFRMALVAAERNHTVIGGGGQSFDALASYGPLTENLLRASGQEPSWQYTLGNLINVFPRAMARVNNGLDEFAKRMAYQGEVRVNAMVEAAEQGLEGQAFTDHVTKAMQASYDKFGHAADEQLLREAERVTLTGKLGEQGGNLRKFTNAIQSMRADIPETRYLLPVFNVPANGVAETLRRLPIARIPGINTALFNRTARELSGELGPVLQADAHGRTLLGGAFLLTGLLWNRMGGLTGAGPQDPTDRRIWLQTHQPYSIKVGDQWVDYRKYDIIGGLLSIPATVSDMTTYHDDEQAVSDTIWSGVGALAQWFQDRSSLQNAASLLALGNDPTKNVGNAAIAISGNVASGFFPAALRGVLTDASGLNPYAAMRRSWSDYVESVVPGNNVELLRNVLGEPIPKKTNTFTEVLLPVSTAKAIGKADDPVLTELDRLYQVTGYGSGADTSSFSHGFFSDKDLKLEDGRSLYTHAMQARQTLKIDGLTLRQALGNLIKSPEYKMAVDGDSGRKLTSRGELSRGWMVSQTFGAFNKEIKANLAQHSRIAREYMTAATAKMADDAYLRGVSVDELATNPSMYAAHGIDKTTYEDNVLGSGSTADLYKAFGQ